jgi:hypothetical protein
MKNFHLVFIINNQILKAQKLTKSSVLLFFKCTKKIVLPALKIENLLKYHKKPTSDINLLKNSLISAKLMV